MSQEFSGGELMRKALALMSDGKVRCNLEITEATGELANSMSRVCLKALRVGWFEVAYRTRAGVHFQITDAGLSRCADIDRVSLDVVRAVVRIPDAPRQWWMV